MTPIIASVPYNLPPDEYLILPISYRLYFGMLQINDSYIDGVLLIMALNDMLFNAINLVFASA